MLFLITFNQRFIHQFTKHHIEHSAETIHEVVYKLEECLIPLNYYSGKDHVRRGHSIFYNDKSDDESYPFNLPTIVTYPKYSSINEDTIYRHTKPSQAYRLEH